jgi:hypothetical protein
VTLQIDSDAVRLGASTMRDAAQAVPTSTAIDAAGCGSSAVVSAADSFNLYVGVMAKTFQARMTQSADNADAAAKAWDEQEAALAAAAAGSH